MSDGQPTMSSDGAHAPRDPQRLRARAEALLKSLEDAKRACSRQLSESNRSDAMETVRGESSFDLAIETARRAIETLERVNGGASGVVINRPRDRASV